MDRMLPLLQNMQNNGGSWAEHKVKKSQVLKRNEYLTHSAPQLWQYACGQIDLAVLNGWLIDE
jgi:putative hydrolase of HD superfamily